MRTSVFTNGLKALSFEDMLDLVKEMGMDCVEIATGGFSPTAHLDIERIRASVSLIQSSGISYEFRTTVAREFQTEEDFREIGLWLSGSAAYYLQPYRDCETLSGRHFHPYTKEEMDAFVSLLQKFIPNSCLRGI